MDGVVCTAVDIHYIRKGKQVSVEAGDFLHYITSERLLQLAMLADSGDEVIIFLRFSDTEKMEIVRIPFECSQFRTRIDWLFIKAKCLDCGYTRHMLNWLSEVHSFNLGLAGLFVKTTMFRVCICWTISCEMNIGLN